MFIKKNTLCYLSLFVSLIAFQATAIEKPQEWVDTDDTVVALVPNNGTPIMRDLSGVYTPTVTGGALGSDLEMGDYIQFAGSGTTGVSFTYTGSNEVLKGSGFTLEGWIKPEPGSLTNSVFAIKIGTFALNFVSDRFSLAWLNLPTNPIYIEPGSGRYNYYPMSVSFNGTSALTMSAWNHVSITYDENLKVIRTWLNGTLDREGDVLREGQQWVNIPTGTFSMFTNLHSCKVAGIRLRAGAHNPAATPPMNVYLTQLSWQNKMVLTADKIDPSLALPISISAVLTGIGIYTTTLSSWQETVNLDIPMPSGSVAIRTMNITASANGTQVFNKDLSYANNIPASPVPTGGVTINSDKSVSKNGVKIFPRIMYLAQNADMANIKGMGFNTVIGKDPNGVSDMISAANITDCTTYAAQTVTDGLFCTIPARNAHANFNTYMTTYPSFSSLLFWYCADEPWNNWDTYIAIYNNDRVKDANHPVMTVINNSIHIKNGTTTCDILACDPYPLPNVALRYVADLTECAVRGSFGLKPVWTILDAYNGKMPTLDELRCMTFLALGAGANGIGIYSWDDRLKSGGVWTGYYMQNDYPSEISIVSTVMQDLGSLESILVESNVSGAVSINPEQLAFHAAIKRANGHEYLFLVNDSRQSETGTITLASGKTALAQPLAESGYTQTLQFTNGSCQVTLPAMAAGVFEVPLGQCPYYGTPTALPGKIQAEDYDLGGEGVAYHDTSAGNYGNVYRSDDVDITTTNDIGGGYRVGWFWSGEWLKYTVNPQAGSYNINLRISTPNDNAVATLYLDGVSIGSIAIPNTGSSLTYQTATLSNVTVANGVQVLQVKVSGSTAFDLNWIEFVKNP